MKNKFITSDVQSYLTIGYIYLIIMGILNQTSYYIQLDIEILKYSSIMDVLLSPVSRLASSFIGISIFIVLFILIFALPPVLAKKKDSKWFKKIFKIGNDADDETIVKGLQKGLSIVVAMGIFGFYTGNGLGQGAKLSSRIADNEIAFSDKITFMNNEAIDVKILGTTSSYIFYLLPDTKHPVISPINTSIKSFEFAH